MPEDSAKNLRYDLLKEENVKQYILPHYGLENGTVSQIKFKDTDKQRAVYRIETPTNKFCLKKIYFDKAQLLFVYSAIEWLYRYEINVPRILPTLRGGRFVEKEGMLFILTEWVNGDKCDYDNIENVMNSSRGLAKLHQAGINFKPILGSAERTGFDDIFESTSKHFQDLLKCSNLAFKYKDRFSKVFLDSFDSNLLLAAKALEISSSIDVNNLRRSLCHGDYVNKNIIFDKNNNVFVIDFDKCKMDYCCHDVSYFLRRLLKRENTKWDFEIATNALSLYSNTLPLSIDEYKYIIAYLAFPQKYWKLSKDYYNNINKCNKHSFQSLLIHATKKTDGQLEFVNKLITYTENLFKSSLL